MSDHHRILADDDPDLIAWADGRLSRPHDEPRRNVAPDAHHEAALRFLKHLPPDFALRNDWAVNSNGTVILHAVFESPSRGRVSVVWQFLTGPTPLWNITFGNEADTYERTAEGLEVVSVRRMAPGTFQVVVVWPSGAMTNAVSDRASGSAAPLGIDDLRVLAMSNRP